MKVFKILGTFVIVGFLLFALAVSAIFYEGRQEETAQKQLAQERAAWRWQHYTGYRLVRGDVWSLDSCISAVGVDPAYGLVCDRKLGDELCSTLGYPGYPVCPPQQYVINGQPASESVIPPFDPNQPYQVIRRMPIVKKPKVKTGVILYPSDSFPLLYADAGEHLSTAKAPPNGTKVKIIGHINHTDGEGDFTHISFNGKVVWVGSGYILEDPDVL